MEDRIMKKSFILFTAALSLLACTRIQELEIPNDNLSIFAKTESPTESKTVVESGIHVFWEPGDEIAVFWGEKSAKFTTDITAASGTATFKGTFGNAVWPEDLDLWAVYPFGEDAAFDGETITTTLPSEQIAREGSFGKDMNLSIAHSNSSTLQFYNVGGGIRFSVTEEGIKKVMFEGLSGEIISGNVKIGFEDGLPVVKEVTSGSQFITLLPPSGKKSFEKDTWYYIVAIPGALEGGYKLRFYKDTDYARKVSEKAAVIKRSIFGNIEKADEGTEYEALTTHFPETEEEIIVSNQIAMDITTSIFNMVHGEDVPDPQVLARNILAIDGVLESELNEDQSAIIIKQKDSTYINYLIKYDNVGYPFVSESTTNSVYEAETHIKNIQSINKSAIINQEGMVIPSNKSAVLIIPFYHSDDSQGNNQGGFGVNDLFIEEALSAAGYTLDAPIIDDDATLEKFDINNLCKYGVVIIRTHGVANARTNHGEITTALTTRERIDNKTNPESNSIWGDLSRCIINNKRIYYCSTVPWMEDLATSDTIFPNSLVFTGDCQGMMNPDLRDCFFKYEAAACCGFSNIVAHGTANFAMYRFFNLLGAGTGLHYAHANAVNSQDAINYQHYKEETITNGSQLRSLFRCYLNPKQNKTDLFLNDLTPKELRSTPNSNSVYLSWQSDSINNLNISEIDNYEDGFYMPYLKLERRYSVFIDGKNVGLDITDNHITKDNLGIGTHSWYVVTKVLNDGELCDSFQSKEDYFTVTEEPYYITPEAIDLGLPSGLKWASFNLGASRMSGAGKFFAWGETTPKDDYSVSAYQWCQGSESALTKYCSHSKYGYNGFTDNKDVLDLEDDAAHVHLKGDWRIPTYDEWQELFKKCTAEWTNMEGVDGLKFTSTVAGYTDKWIFIPASGYMYGPTLYGANNGYCWSSSVCVLYQDPYAYAFALSASGTANLMQYRYLGMPIRPVTDESISFIPVTGVTLDKTSISLEKGEKLTLNATIQPADATNKNVSWSSTNPSVATVDAEGVVSAIGDGSARITVTTEDGGMTASCQVTVTTYVPVESISLNRTSVCLVKGESLTLTATVSPSNATDKTLSWRSEDPSVATVDNGRLTALKAGNTTVHVTHVTRAGQTIEAVCSVVVKQAGGSLEGTGEEEWP